MSIKEQVIEIIDSVHPDEAIAGVSIEFVRWLKHKIQAIPDEVTMREEKSCFVCKYRYEAHDDMYCSNINLKQTINDDHYFDFCIPEDSFHCQYFTKAIRGSK
jgi:hypothetical protein